MKWKTFGYLALTMFSTVAFLQPTVRAQGTAFTYQGQLSSGNLSVNGNYNLTFALFSAASGAGQLGSTLTNSAVVVSNGLFTVMLDFGANFFGADRWLEIGVRTNGNGPFTKLAPRQQLAPTPYAIFSEISSSTHGITVDTNNFVGIGTAIPSQGIGDATPGSLLHIDGTQAAIILTDSSGSPSVAIRGNNGTWIIGYNGPPGSEDISIGADDGSFPPRTISLHAGGVERMRIAANGNVGIGTATPQVRLDVNGAAQISGDATINGNAYISGAARFYSTAIFNTSVSCATDIGPCSDGTPSGLNSQFGGLLVNDLWVHNLHSWDGEKACFPAGQSVNTSLGITSGNTNYSDSILSYKSISDSLHEKDVEIQELKARVDKLELLISAKNADK